jgi:hypothetical protein
MGGLSAGRGYEYQDWFALYRAAQLYTRGTGQTLSALKTGMMAARPGT